MKDTIAHIHLICEAWKRELTFFKDEIPYLKKRLEEVASKNTSNELMKEVDHFENKFRIQSIHIDEMLHDIHLKNESILKEASEKPNYINVKMIESDSNIEDLMHDTSSDFYHTKKEFYNFLSKSL